MGLPVLPPAGRTHIDRASTRGRRSDSVHRVVSVGIHRPGGYLPQAARRAGRDVPATAHVANADGHGPAGRAFAAEVRNAGLFAHPTGRIPYPRLREIIANKLETIQAPTDRAIPRQKRRLRPWVRLGHDCALQKRGPCLLLPHRMLSSMTPRWNRTRLPTEGEAEEGGVRRRRAPGRRERGSGGECRGHEPPERGDREAPAREDRAKRVGKEPQPYYICGEDGYRWAVCRKKKGPRDAAYVGRGLTPHTDARNDLF